MILDLENPSTSQFRYNKIESKGFIKYKYVFLIIQMKPIMMILITIMIMELVDRCYLMQVRNTPCNNTV